MPVIELTQVTTRETQSPQARAAGAAVAQTTQRILVETDNITHLQPWHLGTLVRMADHNPGTSFVVQETLDEILDIIKTGQLLAPSERPAYIVYRDTDLEVLGALAGYDHSGDLTEDGIALIAAQTDGAGAITGLRDMSHIASVLHLQAPQVKFEGLGLAPNTYGYALEIMPDGETLVAVPKPAPPYFEITSGTTDHLDLGAAWTKITPDSVALSQNVPVGSIWAISAYVTETGGNTGTINLGIGLNGAQPTVTDKAQTVSELSEFVVSAAGDILTQINSGQTFALWANAIDDHPSTVINVRGSIEPSYARVETR